MSEYSPEYMVLPEDLATERRIDDLVRIDQRANITPRELAALRRQLRETQAELSGVVSLLGQAHAERDAAIAKAGRLEDELAAANLDAINLYVWLETAANDAHSLRCKYMRIQRGLACDCRLMDVLKSHVDRVAVEVKP